MNLVHRCTKIVHQNLK